MRIFIAEFFWPIQKWTGLSLTKLRKVNHLIGTIIPAIAVLSITALHCKDKYAAVALIVICSMFGDLGFTGSYLLSYLDLAPQYAGLLTGMSNMIGSVPGIVSSTITGYITSNVSNLIIFLSYIGHPHYIRANLIKLNTAIYSYCVSEYQRGMDDRFIYHGSSLLIRRDLLRLLRQFRVTNVGQKRRER